METPNHFRLEREVYKAIRECLPPTQGDRLIGALVDLFFTGECDRQLPKVANAVYQAYSKRILNYRRSVLNGMRNRLANEPAPLEFEINAMSECEEEVPL